MYRDGDVESESPVIQHVDCKKQCGANAPFSKRYWRRLDEVASFRVELVVQGREAREDELEQGDEKAAVGLMSCVMLEETDGQAWDNDSYFTIASKQ